jgi:hypothetical protein
MDPRKSKTSAGTRAGELAGNGAGTQETDAGAAAVAAGEREAGSAGDAGAGSPSSSHGPLGSVAVEVDRAAILAEAAAVAAEAGEGAGPVPAAEPAPVPALDVQAKAADVAPAVRLLVAQCSAAFAPNWQITKPESDGVADAAALVLAYWMPDGVLEPKYLAIITLATSLYGVAATRRREDGSWLPLRAPRAPASSSPTSPAPGPAPSPAPAGAPLKLV